MKWGGGGWGGRVITRQTCTDRLNANILRNVLQYLGTYSQVLEEIHSLVDSYQALLPETSVKLHYTGEQTGWSPSALSSHMRPTMFDFLLLYLPTETRGYHIALPAHCKELIAENKLPIRGMFAFLCVQVCCNALFARVWIAAAVTSEFSHTHFTHLCASIYGQSCAASG